MESKSYKKFIGFIKFVFKYVVKIFHCNLVISVVYLGIRV